MRIGIEAQRIFRKNKHGMDLVAVQLIKNLQRIDHHNQYYIFINPDEDIHTIYPTNNFKIILLQKSPYPIWEQYYLRKASYDYKLDVLHCTSNTAPIGIKTPLILTLHDIIYLEQIHLKSGTWYQRIGNLYRRWVVPRIVKNCHTIYTVSEFEKKVIEKHFNFQPEKVKVINNGVATHFKPQDNKLVAKIKEKYGLPDSYLLFLGNADPKKNMLGLLKALLQLDKNQQLTMRVVILDFGIKELEAMLSSIDAIQLLEKIHLPGYIPNEELPCFYSGASAFLYPSLRESFGLPILEAMACKCPVITSNTSSMPGIAKKAAILINPKKPATISEAILRLKEDQNLREELIAKGIERSKQFSYLTGAQAVLETYNSIKRKKR
ncbi:glycosyltransferase family 4 protein [Algoriphagus sp. AGSA1]|uniref:glycosyltransferase family 4 protein n=1 Tax=Algoriphagus sp. AGSA1 TaxID=2907213 RepID=UPI001F1D40C6|nr:glycosyltransferase family 1 protein [Algoriphagus sp. AGSA1]MCE7053742.1 glycosyltransferase family 4 protein [Algoriphagus sp. AGSA1]